MARAQGVWNLLLGFKYQIGAYMRIWPWGIRRASEEPWDRIWPVHRLVTDYRCLFREKSAIPRDHHALLRPPLSQSLPSLVPSSFKCLTLSHTHSLGLKWPAQSNTILDLMEFIFHLFLKVNSQINTKVWLSEWCGKEDTHGRGQAREGH